MPVFWLLEGALCVMFLYGMFEGKWVMALCGAGAMVALPLFVTP